MRATGAGNTAEMDEHLTRASVNLIVLDVMMPGEDGLAACARLRQEHCITPILIRVTSVDRLPGSSPRL